MRIYSIPETCTMEMPESIYNSLSWKVQITLIKLSLKCVQVDDDSLPKSQHTDLHYIICICKLGMCFGVSDWYHVENQFDCTPLPSSSFGCIWTAKCGLELYQQILPAKHWRNSVLSAIFDSDAWYSKNWGNASPILLDGSLLKSKIGM